MSFRLLRTSSRNDGTASGTWSVGDEFVVESLEEAHELISTHRAALPAGSYLPPLAPAGAIERAAFGAGETPESAAATMRTRAPARDGGA